MNKKLSVLHTAARYFLATVFLMYAIGKILGTQFSSSPSIWDRTIGDLSGFELTWFFYGYSFWYGVFFASSQILASFLLFFRRTTRVGIVLYLSIIVNILALDLAYEIEGAIGMAVVLTIVASFVFLVEFKSFYRFFIEKPPVFSRDDRPNWLNKLSKIKFAYIPLVILGLFFLTSTLKKNIMGQNEFYGSWEPLDQEGWSRIYFQEASTFSIRSNDNFNQLYSGKYELDRDNNTIVLNAFKEEYLDEDIDVLNPDSSKMTEFLKLNYVFSEDKLLFENDSLTIELVRLK
jgi:hypothetical protein